MKPLFLLAAWLVSVTASLAANAADVIRIPDLALRGRLLALGVDTNRDGQIQVSETADPEVLKLNGLGLSSAEGLQHFANLRVLELEENDLTALDVSALTKLERLSVRKNRLRALDVSALQELRELDVRVNELTALDVRDLPALEMLTVVENPDLASLLLGDQPALRELYVSVTRVISLDLRAAPTLRIFDAIRTPLRELTLDDHPALERLVLIDAQLSRLDAGGCARLRELIATNCGIRILRTTDAVALESVELTKNAIASADFTTSPRLKKIELGYNPIVELDVRGLAELESLNCFDENRPRPSLRQLNLGGTVRLRFLQL